MYEPFIQHTFDRVPIDEWVPTEDEMVFRTIKDAILMDLSSHFNCPTNPELDGFYMNAKRAYNNDKVRIHAVHYLNYFEKFYDYDSELTNIYACIKYCIDYEPAYDKQAFFYDIERRFISKDSSIFAKLNRMNEDCYCLQLDSYTNKKNPVLKYNEKHAKLLMLISLLMNVCIIPLSHFMKIRKVKKTNEFLLEIFDKIIRIDPDIDIYSKLLETANSFIKKSRNTNQVLFDNQDIRGSNITTHTQESVYNIIINIIPKYTYNQNIINLNYSSIKNNTNYKIIDIEYEFAFHSLSSSHRDEDLNSDLDKYESLLKKDDSALYLQNYVAFKESMNMIEYIYGPFDEEEIKFYYNNLANDDGNIIINSLQKELIFYLFYKYFGDPMTMNMINVSDYIKLMIAAKSILEDNGLILLPHIISSKVSRLASRKSINKKELLRLEASEQYQQIKNKYRSDKIEKNVLSLIATIISSEFQAIEFDDRELNGVRIEIIPDFILDEIPKYISLI